jgi:transcriptional regulator of acetoin/glycerol metabolism
MASGPLSIAESALHKLAAGRWPGNVRELEAVLARALLRAEDGRIEASHLELPVDPSPCPASEGLERAMVEAALRDAGGNLSQAALRIGWSRPKLYRRMRTLGVAAPRERTRRARPRPECVL